MSRSLISSALAVALACGGSAHGQQAAKPVLSAEQYVGKHVSVAEADKPAEKCLVLRAWRMEDGKLAMVVQSVASGHQMTVVETGDAKQAFKVHHWARNDTPPKDAPVPPAAEVAARPVAKPAAAATTSTARKIEPVRTAPAAPAQPVVLTQNTRPSSPSEVRAWPSAHQSAFEVPAEQVVKPVVEKPAEAVVPAASPAVKVEKPAAAQPAVAKTPEMTKPAAAAVKPAVEKAVEKPAVKGTEKRPAVPAGSTHERILAMPTDKPTMPDQKVEVVQSLDSKGTAKPSILRGMFSKDKEIETRVAETKPAAAKPAETKPAAAAAEQGNKKLGQVVTLIGANGAKEDCVVLQSVKLADGTPGMRVRSLKSGQTMVVKDAATTDLAAHVAASMKPDKPRTEAAKPEVKGVQQAVAAKPEAARMVTPAGGTIRPPEDKPGQPLSARPEPVAAAPAAEKKEDRMSGKVITINGSEECLVLEEGKLADGTKTMKVRSLKTGEVMTIAEGKQTVTERVKGSNAPSTTTVTLAPAKPAEPKTAVAAKTEKPKAQETAKPAVAAAKPAAATATAKAPQNTGPTGKISLAPLPPTMSELERAAKEPQVAAAKPAEKPAAQAPAARTEDKPAATPAAAADWRKSWGKPSESSPKFQDTTAKKDPLMSPEKYVRSLFKKDEPQTAARTETKQPAAKPVETAKTEVKAPVQPEIKKPAASPVRPQEDLVKTQAPKPEMILAAPALKPVETVRPETVKKETTVAAAKRVEAPAQKVEAKPMPAAAQKPDITKLPYVAHSTDSSVKMWQTGKDHAPTVAAPMVAQAPGLPGKSSPVYWQGQPVQATPGVAVATDLGGRNSGTVDVASLVQVLQTSTLPSQRAAAAHSLALTAHPYAVEALVHAARHDSAGLVRASAIEALGQMGVGSPVVVAAVEAGRIDPDPRVRDQAATVLANLSGVQSAGYRR